MNIDMCMIIFLQLALIQGDVTSTYRSWAVRHSWSTYNAPTVRLVKSPRPSPYTCCLEVRGSNLALCRARVSRRYRRVSCWSYTETLVRDLAAMATYDNIHELIKVFAHKG